MQKRLLFACGMAMVLSACSQNTNLPPPETKVEVSQPVAPLVQHLIFFDWDKDIPPTDVADIIRPHVNYLIKYPNRKVLIEGGADETGSYEYNITLGMRRAKAIEALFLEQGVSPQQLIVRSIGIERKLNHEGKPHSLPRNRRVTLAY